MTGVQTCALPISALKGMYISKDCCTAQGKNHCGSCCVEKGFTVVDVKNSWVCMNDFAVANSFNHSVL